MRYFIEHSALNQKIKEYAFVKMDKKRLKIALAVLNALRSTFFETNEFIDSTLKEEFEREKITADEVIFLLLNLQKNISLDNKKGETFIKSNYCI